MLHLKILEKEIPFFSTPSFVGFLSFIFSGVLRIRFVLCKHSSNFFGDLDFGGKMRQAVRRRHHTPEPKAVPSRDAIKVQG